MFNKGWKRAASGAALALVAGWALPAQATVGYFSNGYDVDSQAMAGAGLAEGDGPVATSNNPALGVHMGNTAGGCIGAFMPYRYNDNEGAGGLTTGRTESKDNIFPIPCAGANFKLDDQSALGVLMYANGGMNTYYTTNVFKNFGAGSTPLGVNLEQAFVGINYAREVGHGVTLGVQPLLAVQQFRAYGLEAFEGMSAHPSDVTGNGDDYSYGGGLKIGTRWEATDWLTLAAAWQSKMWMSRLEKYSGLFADGGSFDIPSYITEGLEVKPIKNVGIMLEHQLIFYSDVNSIGNTGVTNAMNLGAAGGAGFGWRDMNVYRIGLQWEAAHNLLNPDDELTLRTGYSHNTQFTRSSEVLFNILAPATITDHAAVGFSYDINKHWEVDSSYMHGFGHNLEGSNPNMTPNQVTTLHLSEDEFTVGVQYRW